MLTNEYLKRVYEGLEKRNANEPEFLQAVRDGSGEHPARC